MEREKIYKKIQKALIKRALGYDFSETVEEYSSDGEQLTMVRKKITTKNVPPDISAAKLLLDGLDNQKNGLIELSDEQLAKEKDRLLALLKEKNENCKG
ncbi:MAG: hypothetical protein IJW13_00870 [Clostridia bacterium]|nr:hypothetical protein [Clostridia bacterium]